MKKVLGLTSLLVFIAVGAHAAEFIFNSDEEFAHWMTCYYTKPEPKKAVSALQHFVASKYYAGTSAVPMSEFFATIFQNNPQIMTAAFKDISQGGSLRAKRALIDVIALTNTTEGNKILKKAKTQWANAQLSELIDKRLAKPVRDPLEAAVDRPVMLDMLWSKFFATGSDLPVKKIISVLPLSKTPGTEKDKLGLKVLGAAAQWSLESNVKQHVRVYEICQKELPTLNNATKEILSDILRKHKPTGDAK